MGKHTPGPWEFHKFPGMGTDQVHGPNHKGIADLFNEIDWNTAEKWNIATREEADANGRLIAAAPEMLEALEFLVAAKIDYEERGDVFHPEPVVMRRIYNAITKANGETNE